MDGGYDKSAPHSARYQNLGPAEAGKLCDHSAKYVTTSFLIVNVIALLAFPTS